MIVVRCPGDHDAEDDDLIDREPKRLVDQFATPDIEYVDPPDDVDPGSRRGRTDVMLALRRAR